MKIRGNSFLNAINFFLLKAIGIIDESVKLLKPEIL